MRVTSPTCCVHLVACSLSSWRAGVCVSCDSDVWYDSDVCVCDVLFCFGYDCARAALATGAWLGWVGVSVAGGLTNPL